MNYQQPMYQQTMMNQPAPPSGSGKIVILIVVLIVLGIAVAGIVAGIVFATKKKAPAPTTPSSTRTPTTPTSTTPTTPPPVQAPETVTQLPLNQCLTLLNPYLENAFTQSKRVHDVIPKEDFKKCESHWQNITDEFLKPKCSNNQNSTHIYCQEACNRPTKRPWCSTTPAGIYDLRVEKNIAKANSNYSSLAKVCTDKGKRVCMANEICDGLNPKAGMDVFGSNDNWIAVGDSDNEWLTLNTMDNRRCKTHTQIAGAKPGWGTQDQGADNGWERAVKCCDGPAPALATQQIFDRCYATMKPGGHNPGITWGNTPQAEIDFWAANNCNNLMKQRCENTFNTGHIPGETWGNTPQAERDFYHSNNDMCLRVYLPRAQFFEHNDYQGASSSLPPGVYNLDKMGISNDMISSVKVPPGYKVTLFEHGDFQGATKVLTSDTPGLPDFNDKTSSIKIVKI